MELLIAWAVITVLAFSVKYGYKGRH